MSNRIQKNETRSPHPRQSGAKGGVGGEKMKRIANPLLAVILTQVVVAAASATVSWLPNPEPDIAGYWVHYKPADTNAMTTVWTTNPCVRVDHLREGRTYVFYVTAVDTAKRESRPSESVRYTPTMLPIGKLNLAP